MTGKFIEIKWLLLVLVVLTALMTGCGSTTANEIPDTPNEVQEMKAVSEQVDLTEAEQENTSDEKEVISETDLVNDEQQTVEAVDITLDDLTEAQLEIFKATSISFVESVRDGAMSIDDLAPEHDLIIDTYIMLNELPQNARQLFNEWKDSVGYYEKLTEWIGSVDEISAEEVIEADSGVEVTQQTNKPQSSESQVKEQAKDAQERVSGTTTDNSNETVWIDPVTGEVDTHMHSAYEELGSGFDRALTSEANRIAKQQGISFEEALAKVKADWGVD